jgi:hypothetical protein
MTTESTREAIHEEDLPARMGGPESISVPDERPRDERTLELIMEEVKARRILLFENALGKAFIELRLEDWPCETLPLFDDRVGHWLTAFASEKRFGLLHRDELRRILTYLAGAAMRNPLNTIDDPTLLDLITSDPNVLVIYEFMYGRPRIETKMKGLWVMLRRFGQERGILVIGKRRFAGGAQVLSREIDRRLDIFRRLGLQIETKRSNGSHIIISWMDDSDDQSSAQASTPKSQPLKGLGQLDGKSSVRAILEARKASGSTLMEAAGDERAQSREF